MTQRWLSTDLHQAWLVVVSAIAIFVSVVVVVRVVGLRAFSKMSSFDFAVTVATGSVMASVAASSTSLANGVLALVVLYACQWIVSQLRRRTASAATLVDNQPVVLMLEGEFIAPNLTASRVTEADVYAKLREANVRRMADVRAVVLETTGEVSVLHGDGPVDHAILADVRGFDPTRTAAVSARQSDDSGA